MGVASSAWRNCASSEDSDNELEADSIWDVFDVGERLGSGNFGEVRSCRRRGEKSGQEELAVKIVDKESAKVKAADAFQTARDELEIMAGLSHPHVVELKHVYEDDRFLYVVMELVPGGELFKAISDKRAVVFEDDISSIGLQTFDALEYLHGRGIVHRDIKAQNILLQQMPKVPGRALERADVKLIDFGLATRIRQECMMNHEAQLDLVCGTPAMCAPEIWAAQTQAPKSWQKAWGTTYGPKVDVWAAGVVLYMALFGRLPFHEKWMTRLSQRVCDPKDQPSYESKDFQVSQACQQFLSSVLQKDQNKRLSSAEARKSGWLHGRNSRGRHTRGLSLTPVPLEVREAAFQEAQAMLAERFPGNGMDDDFGGSVQSVARHDDVLERAATFERLRREGVARCASPRSLHRLRGELREGSSSDSDVDGAEDEPKCCFW